MRGCGGADVGGELDGELLGVLMRYAAKRDATEPAVIDTLRRFGCTVVALSQSGIPDLLVRTPDGCAHLVECKAPKGSRTPAQVKFLAAWGHVPIVRSSDEAVKWLCGACRQSPAARAG